MSALRVRRATAVLLALVLLGCGGGIERDVERAAAQARADQEVLDLGAVVPGAWDRVGVYGPYTGAEVIEETLGVAAPALAEDRLARDEAPALLLFARDTRVVAAAYVERDHADFTGLAPAVYPAEAARFTVREERAPDGALRPLVEPTAR